jgi:hypothetical protein
MSEESDLVALIELIHEALLDSNLWPSVLVRLADATGSPRTVPAEKYQFASAIANPCV